MGQGLEIVNTAVTGPCPHRIFFEMKCTPRSLLAPLGKIVKGLITVNSNKAVLPKGYRLGHNRVLNSSVWW